MKWNIITDSSCDMKFDDFKFDNIRLAKVPFVITIDGKDYVDDDNLDVDNMLDIMEASSEAGRSACPSPITWYEQFEQADYSFAITISSLSTPTQIHFLGFKLSLISLFAMATSVPYFTRSTATECAFEVIIGSHTMASDKPIFSASAPMKEAK